MRQYILLGLMLAVAAYAGITSFSGGESKQQSPLAIKKKREVANIQNVIKNIREQVTSDKLATNDVYTLNLAAEQARANPFIERLPLELIENLQPAEELLETNATEFFTYSYEGFLSMGDLNIAVINGMEYVAGDELANGDTVKSISPVRVILLTPSPNGTVKEELVIPFNSTPGNQTAVRVTRHE